MRYRVHRLDLKPTRDLAELGQSLNAPAGEAVAIVPDVAVCPSSVPRIGSLQVVERIP